MSSTRYKISNRNIYGFKINLPQTILLLPVMMALALLVEFALGPILYPFCKKKPPWKKTLSETKPDRISPSRPPSQTWRPWAPSL